jgi:hypothetical protein
MNESDLVEIEKRVSSASPGPWKAYVEGRDHDSGDTFIMIGEGAQRQDDMYVFQSHAGPTRIETSDADLDFIAEARQDIPRLLAEIRKLKAELQDK